MRWVLVEVLARIYRWGISPAIHALAGPGYGCRFQPTCGSYAEEAVQMHGFLRGIALGLKRFLRCHPWSRGGWDPVPGVQVQDPCCRNGNGVHRLLNKESAS